MAVGYGEIAQLRIGSRPLCCGCDIGNSKQATANAESTPSAESPFCFS